MISKISAENNDLRDSLLSLSQTDKKPAARQVAGSSCEANTIQARKITKQSGMLIIFIEREILCLFY